MQNEQNTQDEHKDEVIKEKILEEIREGKVSTLPRAYFVARALLLSLLVATIIVLTIFLCNFLFFALRISGHSELLGFGPRGFWTFLMVFPWFLLLIDLVCILALQWLLRNFRSKYFGYTAPILPSLVGLIVLAVIIGFAVDSATSLNDQVSARLNAYRENIPKPFKPIGGLYAHVRKPLPPGSGICRCTILNIEGNILIVEDTRDATTTLRVVLPFNDRRATTTFLRIGDMVFIAGEEDFDRGVISAFGVRKVGR